MGNSWYDTFFIIKPWSQWSDEAPIICWLLICILDSNQKIFLLIMNQTSSKMPRQDSLSTKSQFQLCPVEQTCWHFHVFGLFFSFVRKCLWSSSYSSSHLNHYGERCPLSSDSFPSQRMCILTSRSLCLSSLPGNSQFLVCKPSRE